MRRKNWLAWLLIAVMLANHTSVAFAAADESGSAVVEAPLRKATASNAEKADLASDSDAEESDPYADMDLIDDVTEDLAEEELADELASASDMELLPEIPEEEFVLTDTYEIPWSDLMDIPDQFAAVSYALESDGEELRFGEEGTVSGPSGYFGDQLTRQKAADVYDFLYQYYEGVVYGDMEPSAEKVNLYDEGVVLYSELLENWDEESGPLLTAVKEEMGDYARQAYYAFLYDHPEMFWEFPLSVSFSMSGRGSAAAGWTASVTVTMNFKTSETKAELQGMAAELDDAVDAIVSQCDASDMSLYETVRTAHDAIAAEASYDTTLARTYAHSPYGVLVEGLGVCESYAKAFKWVCDDLGIPNVLIVGIGNTSDGSGSHMWNYLQMDDGEWYAADLTWDDQDSGIRYEYFLVGADSPGFREERFADSHEEILISVLNGVDGTEYFLYPLISDQAYEEVQSGWQQDEAGNWYYYQDGEMLRNQLLELNGDTYYLQESGARKTGWQQWEDGRWSHFNSEGKMRKHEYFKLKEINEKMYAFDANGYMLSGWVSSAENKERNDLYGWQEADYYFGSNEDGWMRTGWQEISVYGGWKDPEGYADYWFMFKRDSTADNYGAKRTGWREETNKEGITKRYYLDETGAMREGLTDVDGVLYYFDLGDGHMLTGTEVTVDGVKYVIDENGVASADSYRLEIISQPQNAKGAIGDTVSFSVEADGARSYQWQFSRDGGETWQAAGFAGSRSSRMDVELNAVRLQYLFRCELTGEDGSILYTDAVKAEELFEIVKQPENVTAYIGDMVTFNVEAGGVSSYQWQFSRNGGENWQAAGFSGSKTAEMTLELNADRIRYIFRCELTGRDGSRLYTDIVKAEEIFAITKQPVDVEASVTDTVAFDVEASGARSYQWQFSRDGGETWQAAGFAGSKTAEMTVELNADRIRYIFRCELTGQDGSKLYTDIVKAEEIFTITKQPVSVEAYATDTVTFDVEASGVSSYQWQFSRDGGKTWQAAGFAGSKTSEMTVDLNADRIRYIFRCELTGWDGSKLYTDLVKADTVFEIISQPVSVEADETDTVVFEVEASGAISYQWQFSRDGGEQWQAAGFAGCKTSTMTVDLNATRKKYIFRCELTNADGDKLYTEIVNVQ